MTGGESLPSPKMTSLPALPVKVSDVSGAGDTVVSVVSLALAAFVFSDRRFRANGTQIGGAVVLGLLVVAGWYVSGHLGFGENPATLEDGYFATNSRTLESFSFVGPLAYGLSALIEQRESAA